jgi:hypothetical protein
MIHRLTILTLLFVLALPAVAGAQLDPLADEGDPMAEPPPSPAEPPPSPEEEMAGDENPADDLETEQRAMERAAGTTATPTDEDAVPEGEINYSHDSQFYLRGGVALPFLFAVKYGDGPRCSLNRTDEGRPEVFCRRVDSPSLDLDIGYGLTSSIELSLWFRMGLTEAPIADTWQRTVGIGVRSYGSPVNQVKFYIAARIVADLTPSDEPNWGPVDIGGRGEFGLAIDMIRQLGFYLQLGATFQVLRGFYLIGDVSAGLQVRIP